MINTTYEIYETYKMPDLETAIKVNLNILWVMQLQSCLYVSILNHLTTLDPGGNSTNYVC